ncbi:hypothetical protein [Candidatus Trichorickettsia mobilis]|uniref:hypothetical protein n=1 Tax=Candidatus Trichorickettsia mobilis TaxID=1346319 RepID=UPI002930146A|nr:hypothetical protein [Candidatus Trichorickettsia mobilis]
MNNCYAFLLVVAVVYSEHIPVYQQDKPPIGGSLAFYISCQLLLSKVICKSLQIIRVKDGNNR